MKQELNALKDSAIKIAKAKEVILTLKKEFNDNVEKIKQETGIKEVYTKNDNAYDNAKALYETFKDLFNIIVTKKIEDPRYDEKTLKQLALNEYVPQGKSEEFNKITNGMFESVIDTYFLYEKCGFSKIRRKEQEVEELENSIKNSATTILDESKEAAVKVGNSILDVVKPYGVIAKGQFDEAKEFTKEALNKGSKKLIKFLENVENKTNKK